MKLSIAIQFLMTILTSKLTQRHYTNITKQPMSYVGKSRILFF
jgi:hypothetical protein